MRVRPLRPYLRQHFNVAERVAVLTAHLQTMAQYFASNPQLCLDEPGLEVAQLEGKNGARYFVHVGGNT
ncbi:DUF535 family protein, partial [Enterococcus gallinarum]|uniref:DUF535 family protein n=1 Tax=Enterococcus gallinarum TaxID=1353 RepID=UPI003D12B1BE